MREWLPCIVCLITFLCSMCHEYKVHAHTHAGCLKLAAVRLFLISVICGDFFFFSSVMWVLHHGMPHGVFCPQRNGEGGRV